MPRKPDPPPVVEVVVDTSPEARVAYTQAIKILVQRIRERQNVEGSYKRTG
jgi:hypothetical protein